MKKKAFLTYLAITVTCGSVRAESNGFFTVDHSRYKVEQNSVIELQNMPPVRSQDSIGICFAFEAAGAVDAANCYARNWDCNNLTDRQRVSVLDLAHYSSGYQEGKDKATSVSSKFANDEGGNALLAINNAIFDTGYFIRESCAPFDQVVAKQGSPQQVEVLQKASWENLKNLYVQLHKKFGECEQCAFNYQTTGEESSQLENLKEDFKIGKNNSEILKAFAAKTYSEFLFKLLIPEKCSDDIENSITLQGRWNINFFPKDRKDQNYAAFIGKVKEVLKEKNPVMVNNYCALDQAPKSSAQCSDAQHGFLIAGYRKVCDAKKNCREVVKVHNSWGQNWQDHNDDGWVDAKELFSRTYYQQGTLGWLEQPSH